MSAIGSLPRGLSNDQAPEVLAPKMFDLLRIALIVGVVAVIVAVGCFTYVGIAYSGSRYILAAVGTLVGAAILLAVPLWVELRGSKTFAAIRTEFTTDRAIRKIEQRKYPVLSRAINEMDANKFLLTNKPAAFAGDGEKLWRDMSLFSLVLYLWSEQHDWQTEWTSVKGYARFRSLSTPKQCTKISFQNIQKRLEKIGNFLSGYTPVSLPLKCICLPPQSSIDLSPSSVRIKTLLNQIIFVIEPQPYDTWYVNPARPSDPTPLLEDGHPRFATRRGIIHATIKSNWLRAPDRDMPKYQTWANGVVDGARKWFDTEPENWIRSDIE
jgi:hypothetical protein